MTKDYKQSIKDLSVDARNKISKLVEYIIELGETTPSGKNIKFRPIQVAGFPVDQQYNILTILEEWRVIKIKMVDDQAPYEPTTHIVPALETLRELNAFIRNPVGKTMADDNLINKFNKDTKWPENFHWKDENTYDLGGQGELKFMPKLDNKTKTYFKMMADKKDWVEVSKMAEKTGERPDQVRVKVNQIKQDKIHHRGYSRLIDVEAKKDYSGGAYRLLPYPKLNV